MSPQGRIIGELNGFELYYPLSGGKAGAGLNKTTALQVRRGGVIVKQFRYNTGSDEARLVAIRKAKQFMKEPPPILWSKL